MNSERGAERECSISLSVNGECVDHSVPERLLLVDFLRDRCGLSGVRVGCGEGYCGSCTILLDGDPVRACLMFAVQANGTSITTVEGLAGNAKLEALKRSFKECHALQCGFCTPGILVSLTHLLETSPAADDTELKSCLTGHLCRCTGYRNIVSAASNAMDEAR